MMSLFGSVDFAKIGKLRLRNSFFLFYFKSLNIFVLSFFVDKKLFAQLNIENSAFLGIVF